MIQGAYLATYLSSMVILFYYHKLRLHFLSFPTWLALILCLFVLVLRCLCAAYEYMATTTPSNVLPPVSPEQLLHHCIEVNPLYCLWND